MKYDLGHYGKIVGLGGWTFDFAFNENHSTGPIFFFGKELDGIKASLFALREGYRHWLQIILIYCLFVKASFDNK